MAPVRGTDARALVLATLGILAIAARTAHQDDLVTLSGQALVVIKDHPSGPPTRRAGRGGCRLLLHAQGVRSGGVHGGRRLSLSSRGARENDGTSLPVEPGSEDLGAAVATGAAVTVTGRRASSGAFVAVSVEAAPSPQPQPVIEPTSPGKAAAAAAGAALQASRNALVQGDVRTLVVPIWAAGPNGSACPGTRLPTYTSAALRPVLFEESASPGAQTVGSIFRGASHGATTLTSATSAIAGFARIGCSGTGAKGSWSLTSCTSADYLGWGEAAGAAVKSQGLDASKYSHLVLVMPPGVMLNGPCAAPGLGMVGPVCGSGPCQAWIAGDLLEPQLFAHELGHGLGFGHAGVQKGANWEEYGDASDTMGGCCAARGFSLAHHWQAGWARAWELDGAALTPGAPVRLTLTSVTRPGAVGVRITRGTGQDPIYCGYRAAEGVDAALGPDFAWRTSVHTMASTSGAQPTRLCAALADGESWSSGAAGEILVRQLSHTVAQSVVTVCRATNAATAKSCASSPPSSPPASPAPTKPPGNTAVPRPARPAPTLAARPTVSRTAAVIHARPATPGASNWSIRCPAVKYPQRQIRSAGGKTVATFRLSGLAAHTPFTCFISHRMASGATSGVLTVTFITAK
eukprot:scaffold14.g1072.t1